MQQPEAVPMYQRQQHAEQQAAVVGAIPAARTHTCISCQVPIAIHGRLHPCLHAFCLECATEMPRCVICCGGIAKIERVSQPLHISSLSQRTFHNEDDLQVDTRMCFRRVGQAPKLLEAYGQYQQRQKGGAQGRGLPPAPQQQQQQQQLQQRMPGQQQQQQQMSLQAQ